MEFVKNQVVVNLGMEVSQVVEIRKDGDLILTDGDVRWLACSTKTRPATKDEALFSGVSVNPELLTEETFGGENENNRFMLQTFLNRWGTVEYFVKDALYCDALGYSEIRWQADCRKTAILNAMMDTHDIDCEGDRLEW